MLNLNFRTAGEIVAEPGGSARLGEIAGGLGCERVLVVTDAGVRKIGLLDTGLDSLKAAGIAVSVYDGVLADPPESVIEDALAAGRSHRADGVIGFGGGSSMDVAKLAAFLLNSDQKLQDTYGIGNCEGDRLPLIQVPTTAGTGSEVTPIAVVTIAGADKMGVVSPQLYGDVALLDADLTLGLPAPVTAATGLDAMVHAIEAYTSRHKKNAISDALARQALGLLAGSIRTACKTPGDREARAAMLLGACLAGMAFANAPVAAVHALAYPIGG
ncbi:MAG: iron-containing alcohol dehydrogenase, partial [Bauldia litoralis]